MVRMLCMRNIAGKQEAGGQRIYVFGAGCAEARSDLLKHHAEGRAVSPLFRTGTDLLIIKEDCGADAASAPASGDTAEYRISRGEVIEPRRCEDILVEADKLGLLGIVETEIIAEDVLNFGFHQLRKLLYKITVLIEFLFYGSADREHILIGIELYAAVDLGIHMYGKIRDGQDGVSEVHKPALGGKHVIGLEGDDACNAQGSVEPGIVNHSAVGFNAQLEASACGLLGIGLDVVAGPVGMGCCEPEVITGLVVASDMKCDKHRAEALDIVVSALFKHPGFALLKCGKALAVQKLHCVFGSMIGGYGSLQQGNKAVDIVSHDLNILLSDWLNCTASLYSLAETMSISRHQITKMGGDFKANTGQGIAA